MQPTILQSDKYPNSKIFFWFLIFFISGVFTRSLWPVAGWINLVIFISAITFLALDYKNRKNIFLFFCLIGFLAGLWRTDGKIIKLDQVENENYDGYVQIIKEPQNKNGSQKITVEKLAEKNEGKILINVPAYPIYKFGEVLKIKCQLEVAENFAEKFDYRKYLAKDGIYQTCRYGEIKKAGEKEKKELSVNKFNQVKIILYQKIFKVKNALEEKINTIFPQPESAYLAGLLLGGDDRLPEETAENFRRTGTTHTVAVSGYNITILAEFLMILAIMIGFWRQKAFWLAVVGIIFFVLMIGSPASAVRAAVMGILMLWASKKGRLANSFRAIVLAGAIMVWFSPLILLYDVGFQLSFLATLAIVLIYGPLSERMKIENDFWGLKSIFWVTISAQLGVLGILIYTFETFSPISLLANLIILPLIPYIMLGGFAVVLLSFISNPLAKIIALPIHLGLKGEIGAINYLAKFEWSLIEIKGLGIYWLISDYLFFTLLVFYLRRKKVN